MSVRLERWGPGDLELLRALVGDPAMMEHLGGPEPEAKIVKRQQRYEDDPGCLKIVADGEDLGWVGFWDREWRDEQVYEVGWPNVENAPSNAICAKLGFTLLGAQEFEFPPGHAMRCNDWRLDLGTPTS